MKMKLCYLLVALFLTGCQTTIPVSTHFACYKQSKAEILAKKEPLCYPTEKIASPGYAEKGADLFKVDHKGGKTLLGDLGEVLVGATGAVVQMGVARQIATD